MDLIGLGLLNSFFDVSGVFEIIGIIFLFIFFSFSLGSTLWVYCGEVLIEKIIGISVCINLITGGIISFAFPIVRDGLGIEYVYYYFGIFMTLGAAYCYFDLIETKGDTKPQVLNKIYYQ